jgi:hypothetical protein
MRQHGGVSFNRKASSALEDASETRNWFPCHYSYSGARQTRLFGFTATSPITIFRSISRHGPEMGLARPLGWGERASQLWQPPILIQAVERDGFYIGRTAATVTCARWPD